MGEGYKMKRPDEFHEDYLQLQRYKDALGTIPENLSYEEIHQGLIDRTPYLQRHEFTPRAWNESGANNLLEQLNELLISQCVEQLEVEANGR